MSTYKTLFSIRPPLTRDMSRGIEKYYLYQFKGNWPVPDQPHGNAKRGTKYFQRLPKADRERIMELLHTYVSPSLVYEKMLEEGRTSLRHVDQVQHIKTCILLEEKAKLGSGHSPLDDAATQVEATVRLFHGPDSVIDQSMYNFSKRLDTHSKTTMCMVSSTFATWVNVMSKSSDGFVPTICVDAVSNWYFIRMSLMFRTDTTSLYLPHFSRHLTPESFT